MKAKHKQPSRVNRWGYAFVAPFFIVYTLFSLIPLISTAYYSFFEYYREGLNIIGPKFIGFENYRFLLTGEFFKILGNTTIIWLMGFIPQIIVSLLLAVWFTNSRLKLKGTGFFKAVIYMPNLVMASAFSMIFFMIFQQSGPVMSFLTNSGIIPERIDLFSKVWETRGLIALMNFLMWFGNTTILLMAGIMGIDESIIEAAEVDGANRFQVFFRVTLPLLKPIFVYVLITSLIGGIQLFDVPQILTNGTGSPQRSNITLMMYLEANIMTSRNYGVAGAISVLLFIITGILSLLVFRSIAKTDKDIQKKGKV